VFIIVGTTPFQNTVREVRKCHIISRLRLLLIRTPTATTVNKITTIAAAAMPMPITEERPFDDDDALTTTLETVADDGSDKVVTNVVRTVINDDNVDEISDNKADGVGDDETDIGNVELPVVITSPRLVVIIVDKFGIISVVPACSIDASVAVDIVGIVPFDVMCVAMAEQSVVRGHEAHCLAG
jgi:hypothetical protein